MNTYYIYKLVSRYNSVKLRSQCKKWCTTAGNCQCSSQGRGEVGKSGEIARSHHDVHNFY